ncbi:MAG: DUF4127 family protein, partial [Clostridia bacterium]|nr:DUF4127 family protein [Clostridia bacterium]
MKKLFRRVTAAVVCAVMLLTVMPLSTATVSAASSTAPLMAIVPLDNRPVCVDRVIYAAESAGFEVAMPAEDLYRTYLDNQGKNANGTQHGDGAAIMTWLENMDRNEGCDYYVIHLDQMFSGGLVGSRYPDTPMPSSVTVSDAGVLTATELDVMNRLVALASKADNHVYFVDTVMRLASTGSYKGYEVPAYNSFREYAQKTRKVLSTSNFDETEYSKSLDSIKQIYNNYQIGSSGETLTFRTTTDSNYQGLTQKQINEYHFFRLRKLMLINRMAQYGAGTGVYIIGVDDASPKVTIQTNEINFIEARMTALGYEYYLSADTDSCGLMAVARCANDYYSATPRIRVRYYGGMADKAADSYDIGTLRTNVQTHVESLNATYIDEKTNSAMEADVEVLVLTKISDSHNIRDNGASSEYTGNIDSLVSRAKSNIKNNIPTIIIDASTEMNYFKSWVKGLKNLQDELIANVDMSRILGYSNWNTVGNSIGIALGMGIARYAYVKYEVNPTAASHVAFAKSLTY